MTKKKALELQNEAIRLAEEKLKSEWPTRISRLIYEYATIPGFNVTKPDTGTEDSYLFSPSKEICDWYGKPTELDFSAPAVEYEYDLENLESYARLYYEKVAETERLRNLRVAALNKLTEEDKQILGLK